MEHFTKEYYSSLLLNGLLYLERQGYHLSNTYLDWVNEAWELAFQKTLQNSRRIGSQFPHASQNGQYSLESPSWWTAGFWPGMLWLLHEHEGGDHLQLIAKECELALDEVLDGYDRLDHDLGFMWTLTSVAAYKITGDLESKRRALKAANYLAARFNMKGNYIRAWNPWYEGNENAGWAIIDCCMNVPLLFWASEVTGDPRYRHIAEAHMDTVVEHFVRPDGSVNHVVVFNPETGEKLEVLGGQGYDSESAWSRGSAWAIYGLALAYQHTGKEIYLDKAKQTAHYFLSQLPEDKIPYFDFRIPEELKWIKDTSAASCAASGLLLLSQLVPILESASYWQSAVAIIQSLYHNYGSWHLPHEEGLLLHGTSHYPENRNVDVPLIYGDYFYVESLYRLHHEEPILFWERSMRGGSKEND